MTIYFDNAATTYPKPPEVYQAQDSYFRSAANPGRGSHKLALESARVIFETRLMLSAFLGIRDASRLVFTGGCTESINMALKGLAWKAGDVVVTSALEHNSVMRPLRQLERRERIRIVTVPYAGSEVIDPAQLSETFQEHRPKLCVLAEASNVTGDLIDLSMPAEVCRNHAVPLMVDAAQSAGFSPSRVEELGVSLWCASGHKGLLGPPGVGLLYVSPEVKLEPLVAGGTGSGSESLTMPDAYPDHLESGTLPGPAIVGLGAGVTWLNSRGAHKTAEHERKLAARFLAWATDNCHIIVYGPPADAERRTGIVSFQMRGLTPDRVADLLDQEYGIAVRPGLHCAALAHNTLGTLASGLVRASFGPFNTDQEVDELCRSLERIALTGAAV